MNKTSFRNAHKLIPAILLGAACAVQAVESVTVKTEDTGAALVNPGMGWTMHFYSNVARNYGCHLTPADTLDDFPGLSTVYKLGQIELTAKDTP